MCNVIVDGQDSYVTLGCAREIAITMEPVLMALVIVICNGEGLVVRYLYVRMNVHLKVIVPLKVVCVTKAIEEMIVLLGM